MENLKEHYLEYIGEIVTHYNGRKAPRYPKPTRYSKADLPKSKTGQYINLEDEDWDKVWVWSDLHFHHKNIIRFADRPFADLDDMEEQLVENFNSLVGEDDISIWVGDITFAKHDMAPNEVLRRMNGYKILIIGNHDFDYSHKLRNLDFDETHLCYFSESPDAQLVFSHFPINNLPSGIVNIHGHQHIGGFEHWSETSTTHINVNCEYHDYKPVSLSQLNKWSKMRLISTEM